MLKQTLTALALSSALLAGSVQAADYKIDIPGQHAFINFKVSHIGFSFIYGSFTKFDGDFSYDAAKPEDSKISVKIDTTSVNTNHAERDKHLRTADFLNAGKFPEAKFVSTSVKSTGDKTMDVTGDFTLNGITKPVVVKAVAIGEGKDPWGGYRAGFEGTTALSVDDFNIKMAKDMGLKEVEIFMSFEGVRQ
ncbi:MAG: YceI family protein [Venatoribacter sp.]